MFEVLSHIWARLGRRVIVERLRHSPPLPPVSSTPVGSARSRPGRQVGDPYQAQKLLACSNQRDTTYSPFTLTYYLRPRRWAMPGVLGNQRIGTSPAASLSVGTALSSPTVSTMYQVGRVREPTYPYKPRSVFVRRHSPPPPPVSSMYRIGRVRALAYRYGVGSVSVCGTADKKSLADWRDFSVCVGITYLPGKSPCKYCRRR